ncbi:3-deoxy-D-manno-octulosonic acid transferase [Rhodobacteraceae bacterium D3-12]|nr:3-deoxy-D-manno-octulosonic acid transferase [Rhodobacteraceae bacterium D3-12]
MANPAIPPWSPPLKLRAFLVVWRLAWLVLMPVILGYLLLRGRREPLYRQRIAQRFGFHAKRSTPHVWVHAVSIGELRSAVPLIRALLARGDHVVTTHFTPAGLAEAERIFAADITAGMLSTAYVPFDYGLAFRRFFRAFRPRLGLVMEVEFWPGMITASRRAGVPLYLCNGQYPVKSYERDRNRFLSPANLAPGFAGVMVKSTLQAERFRTLGQPNIAITGEMRFEQPIPPAHISAATTVRPALAKTRRVITLASVVEAEDTLFIDAIKTTLAQSRDKPFFVYVPRSPARFDTVAQMIADAGLSAARRSDILDKNLTLTSAPDIDILFGDSLGEMYFYLALCDTAVTGGGFNPAGSHNIIEPLALGKPTLVGPEIWTIEYPAVEAIAAGLAQQVSAQNLPQALMAPNTPDRAKIDAFLAAHTGAVDKTLKALDSWS